MNVSVVSTSVFCGKFFVFGKIKRAATRIEPIRALLSALQRVGHLMNVAQIKVGRVNQHASAFLGCDFETPQRRFGKRVFHCEPFIRVIAVRAKTVVRRDEQHAWSTAIETHDRAVAELPRSSPMSFEPMPAGNDST